MDETIIKLAIINSITQLLAEWNLELVSGMESELTMQDGTKYTISVERKGEDE